MTEESLLNKTVSLIRKFVLIIISLFVIYHSVLHIESKRDSCQWLLQHGKFVADHRWQPFGCLLNEYNKTDSKLCLRRAAGPPQSPAIHIHPNRTHLVFMGDTRILQLYHYIIENMLAKSTYVPTPHIYSIFDISSEHDTRYDDPDLGLSVEFRWRPRPTREMFDDFHDLVQFRQEIAKIKSVGANETTNRIIVVGHSLWPVERDLSYSQLVDSYKTNMTRLLTYLSNLKKHDSATKILWSLQDPVIERNSSKSINITNNQIDECNSITERLIHTVAIKDLNLLTSHRQITKNSAKYMDPDGIHSSDYIIEYKAQIILNYICNPIYGYDSTCCADVQKVTYVQVLFITFATLTIIAYMVQLMRPYFRVDRNNRINTVKWQKVPQYDNTLMTQDEIDSSGVVNQLYNNNTCSMDGNVTLMSGTNQTSPERSVTSSREQLFLCLAKLSMALVFMFLCDRTNFFMKENKYFNLANFILPIVYMFALGTFFTELQPDSTYSTAGTVLSKNQTDEWKGWMQLVVLIYNLSSAEKNLRIYMIIRVLLSSYLFLTGFGHFTYFYKTGDLSIRRFIQVILRLNLFVICLCLSMNRSYQHYYFIPLVTFWFTIIYLVMRIKPIKSPNQPTPTDHFWILFKLSLLIGSVTLLYLSEVFFEKIFLMNPWKFLFTSSLDDTTVKSWWNHWSIDRYSVIAGMVYALLHWSIVIPCLGLSDMKTKNVTCHSRESSQGSQDGLVLSNPFITFQENFKPRGSLINTLALCGLAFYTLFAATCNDRASCDEIHAYISFVPIICYIILRNASEFLRNRHSVLFAFIGRISLELSLCQYHIWLAAGQRGLLVLVPGNTTLNLVITSIIFITTAHKISSINRWLAHHISSLF